MIFRGNFFFRFCRSMKSKCSSLTIHLISQQQLLLVKKEKKKKENIFGQATLFKRAVSRFHWHTHASSIAKVVKDIKRVVRKRSSMTDSSDSGTSLYDLTKHIWQTQVQTYFAYTFQSSFHGETFRTRTKLCVVPYTITLLLTAFVVVQFHMAGASAALFEMFRQGCSLQTPWL